jgi:hypothetical protein
MFRQLEIKSYFSTSVLSALEFEPANLPTAPFWLIADARCYTFGDGEVAKAVKVVCCRQRWLPAFNQHRLGQIVLQLFKIEGG